MRAHYAALRCSYLPPPVLDMLNDKQLEGAKRAAIITTALKWLLDHVPGMMVPTNMRPALKLLKGLVPYLGYVGGFVAWSWGYIKKYDKGEVFFCSPYGLGLFLTSCGREGNGVTLTATWLVTVALVPGTWEDTKFPARCPAVSTEEQKGNAEEPAPPRTPLSS